MRANFTDEQYEGFLIGNIIKYALRKKGQDITDSQKIQQYAKWLEKHYRKVAK